MQIDMHYYGIYALARAAGIGPEGAKIIAFCSQFVDDAIDDNPIPLLDNKSAILPTMTAHKPIDLHSIQAGSQWKIWVPFHFLPGNNGKNFDEYMRCSMGSGFGNTMLEHILDCKDEKLAPYLAGTALHAYADSFAHKGFVGYSTKLNQVDQGSIKLHVKDKNVFEYIKRKANLFWDRLLGAASEVASLGHAGVATYPDRPYLKWEYKLENSSKIIHRNNPKDYLLGCENIFIFLQQWKDRFPNYTYQHDPNKKWDDIKEIVAKRLKYEAPKEERSKKWIKEIQKSDLFEPDDEDYDIIYNPRKWHRAKVVFMLDDVNAARDCELGLYYRSAWEYRKLIIRDILPEFNLLS